LTRDGKFFFARAFEIGDSSQHRGAAAWRITSSTSAGGCRIAACALTLSEAKVARQDFDAHDTAGETPQYAHAKCELVPLRSQTASNPRIRT
jgi:hypothetical protein